LVGYAYARTNFRARRAVVAKGRHQRAAQSMHAAARWKHRTVATATHGSYTCYRFMTLSPAHSLLKLKTDGRSVRNLIPYFLVCFCFLWNKQKRDRKWDGLKQERDQTVERFVRPYLWNLVFYRDIPFSIPFFIKMGK